MAQHSISRDLTLLAVSAGVFIATFAGSRAFAIEAGDYQCEIESAVGITTDGGKIKLEKAPRAFRLQAVDAPVTPDELRRPPRSLDYYEAEELPTVSASIDARLFHHPAAALRSRGGIVYSQDANVIVFSSDGAFVAYGLADKNVLSGVAVYSGKCSRL